MLPTRSLHNLADHKQHSHLEIVRIAKTLRTAWISRMSDWIESNLILIHPIRERRHMSVEDEQRLNQQPRCVPHFGVQQREYSDL